MAEIEGGGELLKGKIWDVSGYNSRAYWAGTQFGLPHAYDTAITVKTTL